MKINAALIQHTCTADAKANLEKIHGHLFQAARRGAKLAVLQELHQSLYFCQQEKTDFFDLAEPIPGPTTEALGEMARELGLVIVASLFEKRAAGLYHNTAAVIEKDGSLAGIYRKMHIPDDPGFYEKFYFTPGDLGFKPIATSAGKLGILVCWDQWYPEAARLMALRGAEVLIYPTAIGWDPADTAEEKARQREAWITIQRSHAIANGLFVISANRAGFEPDPANPESGIEFWGSSFICGPQGEFLAQAPVNEEGVLMAELDLNRTEQVRRIWPFLRDRRIDAYEGLDRRFLDELSL